MLAKLKQFLKRGQLFLAQGPKYITTYGRWRAFRLARQIRERSVKPGWNYERLLKMMSPSVRVQLVSSSAELGPALQNYFVNRPALTSYLSLIRVSEIIQRVTANRKAKTLVLNEFTYAYRHLPRTDQSGGRHHDSPDILLQVNLLLPWWSPSATFKLWRASR